MRFGELVTALAERGFSGNELALDNSNTIARLMYVCGHMWYLLTNHDEVMHALLVRWKAVKTTEKKIKNRA